MLIIPTAMRCVYVSFGKPERVQVEIAELRQVVQARPVNPSDARYKHGQLHRNSYKKQALLQD